MPQQVKLLSSYPSRKARGNKPRYVIFHTNGGSNTSSPPSLINYIEGQLASGNLSVTQPHHDVGSDGWDYVTLYDDARAVTSFKADGISISVETQDSGYNNVPLNNDPWTPKQFESLAQIAARANRDHGVPLRTPTHPLDDAGIGHHSMWGYNTYSTKPGTYGNITVGGRSIALNNPWTTVVGKTCPGSARINQMPALIQRALEINQIPVPPPTPTGHTSMIYLFKASNSNSVYATDLIVKWHINGEQFELYKQLAALGRPVDVNPQTGWSEVNPAVLDNIPLAYVPSSSSPAPVDVNAIAEATRAKFTEKPLK